jgi:porin
MVLPVFSELLSLPLSFSFRRDTKWMRHFFTGAIVLTLMTASPAFASPPSVTIPTGESETASSGEKENSDNNTGSFLDGISRSSGMLGDMGGLRPWLSQYGLSFGLQETSEVLGNVTGGINKGFDYDGLTQAIVQMDTQRAFGLYGGTFNISALNIHGRNLSADNLGSLQTSSGIEADRATRLWELWYQQKFLDQDRMDIKVGQQSLDQEFMVSQNANLFVNTMFGWAMVPSADLPGGGPAYPLSALGGRVRAKPNDAVTVMAGVFSGSPTVNNNGDSQMTNPSGTNFPVNGGVMGIAEVQFAYPSLGSMVSADGDEPLARTYKLGVWYNNEQFADQEYDNTGLSLANPNSSGIAQQHRGDYAIYGVADQMLWQSDEPGESDETLNAFVRAMGTPESNRNLVDFSLNAGLVMHEPIPHRDDDTFGIGMGYAHVSDRAAALSRDTGFYTGTYNPVLASETFVEAMYQYQLMPWWQLQPDAQYVFHPGGNALNPNTGQRIGNELVLGLRTNITF